MSQQTVQVVPEKKTKKKYVYDWTDKKQREWWRNFAKKNERDWSKRIEQQVEMLYRVYGIPTDVKYETYDYHRGSHGHSLAYDPRIQRLLRGPNPRKSLRLWVKYHWEGKACPVEECDGHLHLTRPPVLRGLRKTKKRHLPPKTEKEAFTKRGPGAWLVCDKNPTNGAHRFSFFFRDGILDSYGKVPSGIRHNQGQSKYKPVILKCLLCDGPAETRTLDWAGHPFKLCRKDYNTYNNGSKKVRRAIGARMRERYTV
jgi:hypothetical protein